MSFPFLVYFIAIEMVAMKVFLSLCAFGLVVNTFILTGGHIMPERTESERNKKKCVLIVGKLLNILETIIIIEISFLFLFASFFAFAFFWFVSSDLVSKSLEGFLFNSLRNLYFKNVICLCDSVYDLVDTIVSNKVEPEVITAKILKSAEARSTC